MTLPPAGGVGHKPEVAFVGTGGTIASVGARPARGGAIHPRRQRAHLPQPSPARGRFLIADNLTPQKARILLALALTVTADPAEIERIFSTY